MVEMLRRVAVLLMIAGCGLADAPPVDDPLPEPARAPASVRTGEPYRRLTREWQSPLGLTIRTYALAIDGIPIFGPQQIEIYDRSGALVHRAGSGDAALAALQAQPAAWASWQHPLTPRAVPRSANPLVHTRQHPVWYLAHGVPTPALVTDQLDLLGDAPVGQLTVTDAVTGAPLAHQRTLFELEPTYLVYARPDGRPFTSPLGNTLPHPTGVPDHQVPAPIAQSVHRQRTAVRDPWLAATTTQTRGNNVVAFFNSLLDRDGVMADLFDDSGLETPEYGPLPDDIGNDFFAEAADRHFEIPYDPSRTREEYFQDAGTGEALPPPVLHDPAIDAKTIAAFYATNWLHDLFYRAGFDEVAGNAQQSNYGRGGVEGDPLIVHSAFEATFTFPGSEGVSPVLDLGLDARSASRRDDTMDFSTLSHEWGHYLIGRLAGGTAETDAMGNEQGLALHEGIADFVSILVNYNAGDDPRATFAVGSYGDLDYIERRPTLPPGEAPADPMYYGIRRYPSTQDFARNPLTFRHLAEPPPLAIPFFNWKGRGPLLSESHTAGEVFNAALFQCFGNLVRVHRHAPFETVRSRMAEYLVAGLAAFPNRPSFLEARNALLTIIRLTSPLDDYPACRAGFAARGMGADTLGPDPEFGSDDPFGNPPYDPASISESFLDADRAIRFVSSALVPVPAPVVPAAAPAAATIRVDLRNTGLVDLDHTTLEIRADLGAVSFPAGRHLALAPLAPEQPLTASFALRINACRLPPHPTQSGFRVLDYTLIASGPHALHRTATFHAAVAAPSCH